ncbi:hypothetical protein SAMN04490190_0964 [Pseudomonas libanensis]|nr:hypothetical protein SAMN04490190_0964 [Pseudomonas libanensis]
MLERRQDKSLGSPWRNHFAATRKALLTVHQHHAGHGYMKTSRVMPNQCNTTCLASNPPLNSLNGVRRITR